MSDWYVHIDRGVIDSNRKHGTEKPPVTVRKGKNGKSTKHHEIELPAGSRILYDPAGRILPCGARLVITCPEEPIHIK